MRTRLIKRLTFPACFCFLLVLHGCLDPKAVTDFVSAAQQTIVLAGQYGKDMRASCKRIQLVQPDSTNCARVDLYTDVQTVQSVVNSYITNLGRLADKDGVTFSENIDGLEEEIAKLEVFNNDKIKALRNLGSLLAEAAASGYRRKQLMTIIPKADSAFATVMAGLIEFVDEDYRGHLGTETRAIEARMRNVKTDHCPREPLACEIALRQLELHRSEVEERIASIDKFKSALQKLAEAHNKLAVNVREIDAKEVMAELKKYGTEVKNLNQEIKAAF
jgi:hypothetical protein